MAKKKTKWLLWAAVLGGAYFLFKGGKKAGVTEVVKTVDQATTTEVASQNAQQGYFTY